MALFLLSTSVGNLFTAAVNEFMVRDLDTVSIQAGADTWVQLNTDRELSVGQKIDFTGDNGLILDLGENSRPLGGTFMIAEIETGNRVRLMDPIHRQSVATTGSFQPTDSQVSTYALVGPQYFMFFSWVMIGGALVFIVVAMFYKEKTYVRDHSSEHEEATAEMH